MSDPVLSLWDYRQAQYAEAAKWVCGDIYPPPRRRCGRTNLIAGDGAKSTRGTRVEGTVRSPTSNTGVCDVWAIPNSLAHVPYTLGPNLTRAMFCK